MMRHAYLVRWFGTVKEWFEMDFLHEGDLVGQLQEKYPGKEIRLKGHNFEPITNASHWSAAGYGPKPHIENYDMRLAPAHFNPEYFHVVYERQVQ